MSLECNSTDEATPVHVLPEPGSLEANMQLIGGVWELHTNAARDRKCRRLTDCITTDRFAKLCLDQDVFKLCVRNIGAIRNDGEDNSTRSFCNAAYREIILARHGHLCPSCVVLRFKRQYLSLTGVYMGYRERS